MRDNDKVAYQDIKSQRQKIQGMEDNLKHRFYPLHLDDSEKSEEALEPS